ncbi:phospholipase, partial [Vibrio parahaemolyticus]|nr:phospholipase [Vibrio parahaemolyticus]NMR82957.1 phospholipase [Vibrio parahaemolyticus]
MFPNALRALLIFTFSALLVGCAQPYPEVEPDFEANWQTTQHQADVYLIPTA